MFNFLKKLFSFQKEEPFKSDFWETVVNTTEREYLNKLIKCKKSVIDLILSSAKEGKDFCYWEGILPEEIITDLRNQGFEVEQQKFMYLYSNLITWDRKILNE